MINKLEIETTDGTILKIDLAIRRYAKVRARNVDFCKEMREIGNKVFKFNLLVKTIFPK